MFRKKQAHFANDAFYHRQTGENQTELIVRNIDRMSLHDYDRIMLSDLLSSPLRKASHDVEIDQARRSVLLKYTSWMFNYGLGHTDTIDINDTY